MDLRGAGESIYGGQLHHVGLVVRDMDEAIAHFESLGVGPFKINDALRVITIPFKGELHGKPESWEVKISNAKMGDVELELLEPCGGKSALQESLDSTGEGLHHIGFLTSDLDGDIEKQLKLGAEIWTYSNPEGAPGFVYFKPTAVGGLAIELREPGED